MSSVSLVRFKGVYLPDKMPQVVRLDASEGEQPVTIATLPLIVTREERAQANLLEDRSDQDTFELAANSRGELFVHNWGREHDPGFVPELVRVDSLEKLNQFAGLFAKAVQRPPETRPVEYSANLQKAFHFISGNIQRKAQQLGYGQPPAQG